MKPVVLPHYRLCEREVWFLVSRAPVLRLAGRELQLFRDIDGVRSCRWLQCQYGEAVKVLAAWAEQGIISMVPDWQGSTRDHLVVVEPHMDDAALSVGAMMVRAAVIRRITIVSVVTWSAYTLFERRGRAEFADVSSVSQLRLSESELAARHCRGSHVTLGEWDAPLLPFVDTHGVVDEVAMKRLRNVSTGTLRGRLASALHSLALRKRDVETKRISSRLGDLLRELRPTETWIPMGIGGHFDHIRTRQACLWLLMNNPQVFGETVAWYEDLPYARKHLKGAGRIIRAFTSGGMLLQRHSEPVSSEYDAKRRLLAVYASQFKMQEMLDELPTTETRYLATIAARGIEPRFDRLDGGEASMADRAS